MSRDGIQRFSRDTFYRYRELVENGGVESLFEKSRRKGNPKNRVEDAVEKRVVSFATEYPAYGQLRASNELRKEGVFVSACGVRSIWLRHNLETMQKRLDLAGPIWSRLKVNLDLFMRSPRWQENDSVQRKSYKI